MAYIMINESYALTINDINDILVDGTARIALNDELTVVYANEHFFNLLNISEHEGIRLADYIHADDLEKVTKILFDMDEDTLYPIPLRLVTANGDILWIELNVAATDTKYMDFNTVVCNFRDITKLKNYRAELTTTYRNIPCGVVQFTVENEEIHIIKANDFYYKMPGNESAAKMKHPKLNVYHSDVKQLIDTLSYHLEQNGSATVKYRATGDNGMPYWIEMTASYIGERGDNAVYFAIISDITSRHNTLLELEKQRERYALAMHASEDLIIEYSYATDECLFASLKTSQSSIITDFVKKIKNSEITHKDDVQKLVSVIEENNMEDIEFRVFVKSENRFKWFQAQGNITGSGKNKKLIGTLHDIDELKQKEVMLEEKVMIDPLTKTYNRDTAVTLIDRFLDENPSANGYLCVVDLDNFKKINDTYGHLYGDAVLNMAASAIKCLLSEEDIVARFGGDEFIVFIKSISKEDMLQLAENVISGILRLRSDANDTDGISCCIGIVSADTGEKRDYSSLFALADKALYKAKYTGKCKYVLYDENDPYYLSEAEKAKYTKQFSTDFDTQPLSAEHNIISMAFEILDRSDDIHKAVRMLLSHIGSSMKLEKIKIMQVNRLSNEVVIAYAWNRDLDQPEKNGKRGYYSSEDINEYIRLFNKSSIVRFQPDVIERFTPKMQDQLNKLNDRTAFYSAVIDNDDIFSLILYQSDDLERVWTDRELTDLQELTKIVSVYLDKTRKVEEAEQRVNNIMNYDELTSSYTLKKFREEAQDLIDSSVASTFAFIYSDFVHFKYINDLYGFETGDEILRDYVKSFISLNDADNDEKIIISRVSGDEFIAMICTNNKDELIKLIQDRHINYCNIKNQKYPLANIMIRSGLYFLGKNDSAIIAIDRANIARKTLMHLTECKISIFDDNMLNRINFEADIARSMRGALETHRFVAFLQPKVNIDTTKIIGAEALVRWFRSDGTIIAPNDFIPYFERNGFITQVDFDIFIQVVTLLDKWLKAGLPVVPISVNLSRANAHAFGLPDQIISIVKQYNIPPELIEFEITETAFANIDANFIQGIHRLRDFGFKIDIDDFGSGYSSLNLLSEMPADIIKLDKALITKSIESPRKAQIIRHIVDMAVSIDYDIICEGVETHEEVEFLKSIGCHKVQGFYFARPMPIPEFEKMLLEDNK